MLRIFHSIFGDDEPERYPESLVKAAIERAVDATDPWLRGLSGYRRRLRPAVLHAIDYVVGLVERLELPLELSRKSYGDNPLARLFFVSSEQLDQLLRTDPALGVFRKGNNQTSRPVWALLAMECEQRKIFGVDMLGDTVVRDVPQVTVGMTGHRLIDPATGLADTRRMLKRRAFDHLLALALAKIAAVEDEREGLLRHRTLLQAKHDTLEGSSWGFGESPQGSAPLDEIHRQLDQLEAQLEELGGDDNYIEKNLEILIEVLDHAEQQLWGEPLTLIVDRMGIKRSTVTDDAPELHLTELHNAAGRRIVIHMVSIPPAALNPLSPEAKK